MRFRVVTFINYPGPHGFFNKLTRQDINVLVLLVEYFFCYIN
jgi:hypothetical protein